jgi:hypothetical protein
MAQHPSATPRARGNSDAPHLTPVTPAEDVRTIAINQISWGAVLAGVVIALTAQLLLNLLGVGIGLATVDPSAAANNPDPKTFSIGVGIWWAVSGIIAALIGGYAAGRLSGTPKESTTGWHGLIAWAGATLVVFYLLSTALGAVVGGAYNAVSSAMGGLGHIASTAAQTAAPAVASGSNPFGDIEQRIRATGGGDPAAARDAAVGAVRGLVTGDPAQAQAARERAAAAVAQAQNIPIEQAREQVVQYEQQYRQTVEQAKQKAAAAADAAAKATSRAALFSVLALVLGALAAWFGGRAGAVDPTLTSRALVG